MRTSLKRLASNLRLLLWAVALLSMLFSGLLEMLDHHWVERMPTHSHLALNGMGVIAAHQHAYQETHRLAGLEPIETYKPLGSNTEPYRWVSETAIAPWTIYVLEQGE